MTNRIAYPARKMEAPTAGMAARASIVSGLNQSRDEAPAAIAARAIKTNRMRKA